MPYIFRREGPKSNLRRYYPYSANNYTDNLRFTDTLMGELLDEVDKRVDGQRTMYIFMSDHAFQQDPELLNQLPREICRIPLLIHLPGQSERVDIDTPFSTAWLPELLDAYIGRNLSVGDFRELCRRLGQRELDFAWTDEEINCMRSQQREAFSYE